MASGSDLDVDATIHVEDDATSSDDVIQRIDNDDDLQKVIDNFDTDVTISPDRDFNIEDTSHASDSPVHDSDSVSTSGSHKDILETSESSRNGDYQIEHENGKVVHDEHAADSSSTHSSEHELKSRPKIAVNQRKLSYDSTTSSKDGSGKEDKGRNRKASLKNPLKLLRKLTKADKGSKKQRDYSSAFSAVVIDRLPQVFVVKYLGSREVNGIFGLHNVRRPVDELVKGVREAHEQNKEVHLPLLYVVISPKGIDLREHKRNKIKDVAPVGLMPIDFISYGVQDIKYWRVFTCIVVKEMSSRARTALCHAFLCDSSHNGRKMALSLGASFNVYAKRLKKDGKEHNFQVELRPPDELADAFDAECEA